MNSIKYVGLDVHRETTSVAVLNAEGKLVQQSVLATQAAAILDFLHGVSGTLHVTLEEGTHSGWLYDLLVRRVAELVVCNPRENALLKAGSKSDAIDARKLAGLLRAGLLSPVYHGQNSTAAVQHLGRSYAALTEDTTRTMGRLKALYRSQAIACAGAKVFGSRHRDEWLAQLNDSGLQRRARRLYRELDLLQQLRREAKHDLILECRKHSETKLLRTVPWLGPIRVALLIREGADAVSFSHQAAVLGLLRIGAGDTQQRRLSDGGWPADAALFAVESAVGLERNWFEIRRSWRAVRGISFTMRALSGFRVS